MILASSDANLSPHGRCVFAVYFTCSRRCRCHWRRFSSRRRRRRDERRSQSPFDIWHRGLLRLRHRAVWLVHFDCRAWFAQDSVMARVDLPRRWPHASQRRRTGCETRPTTHGPAVRLSTGRHNRQRQSPSATWITKCCAGSACVSGGKRGSGLRWRDVRFLLLYCIKPGSVPVTRHHHAHASNKSIHNTPVEEFGLMLVPLRCESEVDRTSSKDESDRTPSHC